MSRLLEVAPTSPFALMLVRLTLGRSHASTEPAFVDRIQSDFAGGVRSGVNGTPTFFVNDERYDGDWTDVDAFARDLTRQAGEQNRGADVKAPRTAYEQRA